MEAELRVWSDPMEVKGQVKGQLQVKVIIRSNGGSG